MELYSAPSFHTPAFPLPAKPALHPPFRLKQEKLRETLWWLLQALFAFQFIYIYVHKKQMKSIMSSKLNQMLKNATKKNSLPSFIEIIDT